MDRICNCIRTWGNECLFFVMLCKTAKKYLTGFRIMVLVPGFLVLGLINPIVILSLKVIKHKFILQLASV